MRSQVIGSLPAITGEGGNSGAIAAATAVVATVTKWFGEHASEVSEWASQNLEPAIHWLQSFAHTLGIGPSYTPENGGEVHRQLESTGFPALSMYNPYLNWLQTYNPHDVWNTGDVWDYPDTNPTNWRAVYDQYLAAGLPSGALLDANMIPVGLAQAAQSVVQADAYLAAHPNTVPQGGGGSSWQSPRGGSGGGNTYQQSRGGGNSPAPSPSSSGNALLYGGLGLLALVALPKMLR